MVRKPELWLKCIKMHVHDGVPMTKLASKYQFDVSKLKYKVKVYFLHGEPLLLIHGAFLDYYNIT